VKITNIVPGEIIESQLHANFTPERTTQTTFPSKTPVKIQHFLFRSFRDILYICNMWTIYSTGRQTVGLQQVHIAGL
jgi:hypothetical protein